MPCYAMLCYAMLCYAMLCYAMLCYAMLCYAMPCYAVFCQQDLAKSKLGQKGSSSSSKTAVCVGPISISRSLPDPATCPLDDWAPLGGPVRPLLQVRTVAAVLASCDVAVYAFCIICHATGRSHQATAAGGTGGSCMS
jgi:hypothetical protein